MAASGDNMATNVAVNMAVNMAEDLAGPAASDWRYAVTGIQASFRLGPSNEYATLVGSDIDSVTDSIPQARKTVSEAPYVISAPSAGQRPAASGSSMVFTSADSTGLTTGGVAGGLGSKFNGLQPFSWYVYGSFLSGENNVFLSAGKSTDDDVFVIFRHRSGDSIEGRRQEAAGVFTNDAVGPSTLGSGLHTLAWVFDGDSHRIYIDGVAGSEYGNTREPSGLDILSLGFLDRPSPALYATFDHSETLVCLAAHDATEVANVTARLAAEYGG